MKSKEEGRCHCEHGEDEVLICRCEEVSREMIHQAILDGATTIDAVKKHTRAGMGFCQGRTCRRLVARQIAEETGAKLEDLLPPTFRPPTRPVKIKVLVEDEHES